MTAMSEPSGSVGGGLDARLRAARSRSFVGRRTEMDLFHDALTAPVTPFAVLHLHGPGGVGKTALLHRFLQDARQAGHPAVMLDGRSVDPSPDGFRAALGTSLEVSAEEAIAELNVRQRPVLLLDTYEEMTTLDSWLRETLIPHLPASALVVLAGRSPPTAGWHADPAWRELLRVVALRDLPADDARALLAARGVPESRHEEVLRVARGYPLALVLIADVLDQHDDAVVTLEDAPAVIETLLRPFLERVPSATHRRCLYAAAHVGIASEALLRDAVDSTRAPELFDWLHDLSFTEPVATGIAVHDLVSDALNAELRWRDPEGWTALHDAVTRHLELRITRTTGVDQHRAMFDLLRLYRFNPRSRRFFDFDSTREMWLEPATAADHGTIIALARQHEGDDSAALARYWLDRQPEAFTVFRAAGRDEPAGFIAHLVLGDAPGEEVDVDPATGRAWAHVRAHGPVRPGERLRILRYWIAGATYQDPATHHLVSARSGIDWATTERLAWSFIVLADPDFYEPIFRFIDFDRPPGLTLTVGDRDYGMFARDFRITSRQAWRELLQERRLGAAEQMAAQPENDRLLVLAQDDFVAAVRDALRGVARPGGLGGNPLLRSRVVAERAGDGNREEALEALLVELAAELSAHPRDDSKHRALALTYLRPAPTQEAAAERLGLPFSTFRRHLAAGTSHVAERMWKLELHGRDT